MGLSGDSGLGSTYYGPSKMTSLSGFKNSTLLMSCGCWEFPPIILLIRTVHNTP